MCLINSSLGSTVQLFLSLSRKCLHRVTANQGNVCGKNQADCLWMISRELNVLWKVIIITSIIFYIKLYTLIITMMELKQVFCIKKQLINTKSWAYLQFCQCWAYESQDVAEVKKDQRYVSILSLSSQETSSHQRQLFGKTVIEFPFPIKYFPGLV